MRELLRRNPSLANKIGEYNGYYLDAGAPLSMRVRSGDVGGLRNGRNEPGPRRQMELPCAGAVDPPLEMATASLGEIESRSGRWLAALDDFRNWLVRKAA